MKDDRLYLLHIRECIQHIEDYVEEGRQAFLTKPMVHDAVLRRLHTMAESTQRLSEPLKERHPNVPWREIAGFRNVVVHDYLGIDLEAAWAIVERDLPPLRQAVERMLAEPE